MSLHSALVLEQPGGSPGVGIVDADSAPVSSIDQSISSSVVGWRDGVQTARDPDPTAPTAILVVEADRVLGAAVVAQLGADGYAAELARSAEDGRILAARRMPKLVIIGDLEKPRDALALLGEIRASDRESAPWARGLPVIVVSSRSEELDMLRAFEAGADDFSLAPLGISSCERACGRFCVAARASPEKNDASRSGRLRSTCTLTPWLCTANVSICVGWSMSCSFSLPASQTAYSASRSCCAWSGDISRVRPHAPSTVTPAVCVASSMERMPTHPGAG